MLSICKINAQLAGSLWGMREMQGAQGQWTLSKVPVRMGIRHHEQGIVFPSKNIFLLSKYAPA
jgi:hypothetical protein